jgi:AcrR family transcriptional regulator
MDAGIAVVGEKGYGATSIAKITETADVSQGTFYNYFEDRQAMFDVLLPYAGEQMVEYIVSKVPPKSEGADREVARFRVYCEFLSDNPGFYRILYEAEVFAPQAHRVHMDRLREGYRKSFARAQKKGELNDFTEGEIETIISIILGARAYVSMQFAQDGHIADDAVSSYQKLISAGLFL